ncbi:hypothetical protein DID88_002924 [Monilinia fructigena]|uniref:Uncharacterized protein n=1 Tax=Monilinia fructigena TaxID=38457 RepID=A0A395INY5_9HELO|nr:hypothetical protein DID88_002924 [Monilinia fructigena]
MSSTASSPPANQPPPKSQYSSDTKSTYIIAIVVTIVGLLALLSAIYLIRRTRIKHRNPKYIPTNDPHEYLGATGVGRNPSNRPPSSFNSAARTGAENAANNNAGGVDRNASIRSVMTLPAYNMTPGQNEQESRDMMGTRLRANSDESERQGLLGDAASMAASSRYHRRDRSASSVLSIDTVNSDLPSPRFSTSRANSHPDSPLRRAMGPDGSNDNHEDRAGSSPEMIDHDDIPPNSPPGYENVSLDTSRSEASSLPHHMTEPPPDYTSPVYGRGEGPTLESAGFRRSQNLDELMTERRTSTHGTNSALFPRDERRSSTRSTRGVGGIPQLPSLRLGSLPSIHVDPGTPLTLRATDEGHSQHDHNSSA